MTNYLRNTFHHNAFLERTHFRHNEWAFVVLDPVDTARRSWDAVGTWVICWELRLHRALKVIMTPMQCTCTQRASNLHIQIWFYAEVHKHVTMAPTATKKRSCHTMAVKHAAISEVDKGAKKAYIAARYARNIYSSRVESTTALLFIFFIWMG